VFTFSALFFCLGDTVLLTLFFHRPTSLFEQLAERTGTEMQALSAAASWSAFAPRKLTSTLKCRDRVFNVAGKSMQHVEILFLSSPAEVHRSDCRFRSKPQYSAQNIHKISAE